MHSPPSIELNRILQIDKCVPELWGCKNILYIGAHPNRFHFLGKMLECGQKIDLVEIDEDNCAYANGLNCLHKVVQADITQFPIQGLELGGYDGVLWSHGLSLLTKEMMSPVLGYLETMANKCCVILVPWGKYAYSEEQLKIETYPNITALYPPDFIKLGYATDVLGARDTVGSNLLAWKQVVPNAS